ncbi:GspMb/PilO family protein [Ideonella dechloratans]|nr:GspMb/PilO family protein [Ideonella dechloratans]UFU10613.1 GspMb/PilO family protein [Ideonella dechloratans]
MNDENRFRLPVSLSALLGAVRVRAELWVWRHGWVSVLCLGLILGNLLLAWPGQAWLQQDARALAAQRASWEQAAAAASSPEFTTADATKPPLLVDEAMALQSPAQLPTKADLTAEIERLRVLAQAQQISLVRTDFAYEAAAPALGRLRLNVPLKGRYPPVRAWLVAAQRELPNLTVDRLSFKRNAVGDSDLEMTTQLSLWYRRDPDESLAPMAGASAPLVQGARP